MKSAGWGQAGGLGQEELRGHFGGRGREVSAGSHSTLQIRLGLHRLDFYIHSCIQCF